jgi:hypothetical protein
VRQDDTVENQLRRSEKRREDVRRDEMRCIKNNEVDFAQHGARLNVAGGFVAYGLNYTDVAFNFSAERACLEEVPKGLLDLSKNELETCEIEWFDHAKVCSAIWSCPTLLLASSLFDKGKAGKAMGLALHYVYSWNACPIKSCEICMEHHKRPFAANAPQARPQYSHTGQNRLHLRYLE